jgi:hypothetical protein
MNNKSRTIKSKYMIRYVLLAVLLSASFVTFAQVQTQIVGDTVYIKTDTQQRLSVWKDGTVNIAPNNTTTQPIFRFYPNGDFSASSTNEYILNQFSNKNGLRFNKKLGILEIGVSNNLDTSLNLIDTFQTSALLINSDVPNTIKSHLISSIIAGDNITIEDSLDISWSIVSGERHVINKPLRKSYVYGWGHSINAGLTASTIMGQSNRIDSSTYNTIIGGLSNSTSGTNISCLVSGWQNSFGGHAQLLSGVKLRSRAFASTTLGTANVDFTSLAAVRNAQPTNLKDYPVLAIGNSSNYDTHRSNAFTMLFNGRTQINTTGYDSALTESQVTPKAALEVVSTNSGVLLPKLTTTQRNAIASGDKHNGLLLYNTDSAQFQYYDGSLWRSLSDSYSQGVTSAVQTLSYGSTVTWNVGSGTNSTVTLTGDAALSISNPVAGQEYRIRIKQGSGAPNVITDWPGGTLWPGGTPPTLSTSVDALDLITFYYDGTNFFGDFKLLYQPGPTYDVDARKYFDSVATTGSLTLTEKDAWNAFVLAAKSGTNYWGNIAVINPVLGATSAEHAWNAKDPATFKATYNGTITHTANHMVSNGTTGYVNSNFNMNTHDGDGLATIGVWVRNNVDAVAVAMGAISATNRYTQIYPRFGNTFYGQVNTNNAISEAVTVSTSAGLSLATRLTSTGIYIQRNATQTAGTSSSLVTNNNIYVLAQNSNGSAANFSTYQVCMYMIATTPFTTAQASQFYTDFSTFITAVGR